MAGDVRLGLSLGSVSLGGEALRELAVRAEAIGYESVWTSEAWGADAFTPLTYIAAVTSTIGLGTAIAQMAARTPAATAMSALTIQNLSGGRLQLGLGVSGPQVVEGWHGVAFGKPLAKSREYIEIVRRMLAADAKVEFDGAEFQVPFRGAGATGLGKPLRTTFRGVPAPPILLAAIGPRNVALASEVADGLLPYLWSPTRWELAWGESLGATRPEFAVAPTVVVAIGDDLTRCRDAVRPHIALHVGGMGAKGQNFYNTLVTRYGYGAEASEIQERFLSGDRSGAEAAVTDALIDDLALVGSPERVAEHLVQWRRPPVTTLIADPVDRFSLEELARIW